VVLAVFLACAVEMVEALTIVVAVGATRGWRSALEGAAAAVVALGLAVVVFGPTLIHLVPLSVLRVVIGVFLLYFGATWLRKAILRASGRKTKHDEAAIYARTVASLSQPSSELSSVSAPDEPRPVPVPVSGRDRVGFVVAFKGVFLEGLEVVIIVLTLGVAGRHLVPAVLAALAALIAVTAVGVVVAKPLTRVPENAMKMVVGIMLMSFGTFWIGEGLHLHWPGSDLFLLALIAFYAIAALVAVRLLATAPPD
jgi:Ca2+/H+ antiporter, TMEM165/GDT1 family